MRARTKRTLSSNGDAHLHHQRFIPPRSVLYHLENADAIGSVLLVRTIGSNNVDRVVDDFGEVTIVQGSRW